MKPKYHITVLSVILIVLLTTHCSPSQAGQPVEANSLSDEELASTTLVDFLESLHEGRYDQAAWYYGGPYDEMTYHNPSLEPSDHVGLLRNACTINGVQCLEPRSVELESRVSADEFIFKVTFLNPDGSLFVLGPCCGASETDFPPVSVFEFTVRKVNLDRFQVMDMPPYVP
jgi:hypothetical protein